MAGETGRAMIAALFATAIVIAGVPSAATAEPSAPTPSAPTQSGPSPSGPTAIGVPYLGRATIEPAAGWQIIDCAGPAATTPLVVACDPTRIELAAPNFDPAAKPVVLPVALSNGRTSMVFDYVVTTEPPAAPKVAAARSGAPVAAGSVVLVPISDLGVECAVCVEGGSLEVAGVSPEGAGTAVATPTHVVFRPAADFAGEAELHVRFVDDFGTRSNEVSHLVPVYRAGPSALIALSVFAPFAASGATSLDLTELAFSAGGGELRFVGCGTAVHGTVVCGSDGSAEYTPSSAATVDQFSFRVVDADGEQATGSVTLVADDGSRQTSGPVPTATDGKGARAASAIVPAIPVEQASEGREGVFVALIDTLDRVGAR
ncbi:MAG: hypothetical protein M3Y52_01050 [Actinomycetota bacterium]|nr:hypothetical protein [Actinomycetota bacterium]